MHNKSVFTFEAEIKNSSAEGAEAAVRLINGGRVKFLKVPLGGGGGGGGVTLIKLNLSHKAARELLI